MGFFSRTNDHSPNGKPLFAGGGAALTCGCVAPLAVWSPAIDVSVVCVRASIHSDLVHVCLAGADLRQIQKSTNACVTEITRTLCTSACGGC